MFEPYYQDGHVTLYHGDCMDVLPSLTGVDMVFTSPPYNMGRSARGEDVDYGPGEGIHAGSLAASDLSDGYDGTRDSMPHAEYAAWQTEVLSLCWATLSDTGAIFYNHKPRPMGGTVKLPVDYGSHLPLRQVIVWDRGTGMNFSASHFLPKSEWIMVWAKPSWRLRDKSASQVGDVWTIRPETAGDHPAPFPIELPATAIAAAAPSLVVDPFAGSGTTLRAAKDAGVRAVGIEQSERYCELIVDRLAQEVLPW